MGGDVHTRVLGSARRDKERESTTKNIALIVVVAFVLLLLRSSVSAQDTSAVNVQTSCAHWSKLRVDKHKQFKGDSDDLYETGMCAGYFNGLMDGMDNTGGWQLEDGTTAVFQIKRSAISSTWDVIRAFYTYVDANPLANGNLLTYREARTYLLSDTNGGKSSAIQHDSI